jgi:hypothetical protein
VELWPGGGRSCWRKELLGAAASDQWRVVAAAARVVAATAAAAADAPADDLACSAPALEDCAGRGGGVDVELERGV